MDRILQEKSSHFVISRLSLVEMESVLATKVRTREIDQTGLEIGRRCLRADLVQGRLTVGPPILTRHYQVARRLLLKFGATEALRTLDALQLSIALDLQQIGKVSVLVLQSVRVRFAHHTHDPTPPILQRLSSDSSAEYPDFCKRVSRKVSRLLVSFDPENRLRLVRLFIVLPYSHRLPARGKQPCVMFPILVKVLWSWDVETRPLRQVAE